MRRLSLSVALQLILVFASGSVVGGLAYRLYSTRRDVSSFPKRPPGPPDRGRKLRERYVQEMRSRLKLRDEQVQQLTAIMDATGKKFFEAKKKSDAELRTLHETQVSQIRAMLDPEQRAEYEKILQEREQQMERDRQKGRKRGP